MRALVTAIGLGANRPQDAVYPTSLKAANGSAYDGANKYVIRFEKDQTPPVEGFWSITMYNDQYFFVANPINRYSISPRQNLKANADGSIDIYVQKDSPGADKEIQLAACSRRQVYFDVAHVLAERNRSIDRRWDLENTAGRQGVIAQRLLITMAPGCLAQKSAAYA